jgi:hypothetical protein
MRLAIATAASTLSTVSRGPRRHFVAATTDDIGARANEDETVRRTCFGERRLLGQEAVPRVHCVAPREQSGTHNLSDPKVALCRAGWSDVHDAVGQPSGERVLIGIADGNYYPDAFVATRSNDSNRYLPAVGNENPS